MTKIGWGLLVLAAIVIIGGAFLLFRSKLPAVSNNSISSSTPSRNDEVSSSTAQDDLSNDIKVSKPASGEAVASPLSLSGQARGSWYFEATAPVKVTDASGKVLGTGHIQAQGEWMTTNFVPFTGTIDFKVSTTSATTTSGFVVFNNDNPSGDPARSKSVSIPVVFK